MEAYWAIDTLRSRIFDDELRELVAQAVYTCWAIIGAQDQAAVWERTQLFNDVFQLLNERVTVLLKELS